MSNTYRTTDETQITEFFSENETLRMLVEIKADIQSIKRVLEDKLLNDNEITPNTSSINIKTVPNKPFTKLRKLIIYDETLKDASERRQMVSFNFKVYPNNN